MTTLQPPNPESQSALVSTGWLAANLDAPNLLILDASVPPVVPGFVSINTDGHFAAIPGARRFDYDQQICKPDSPLPHTMPDAALFQEKVRELGAGTNSVIVVYDDVGIYASPRAWWMFKAMGHDQVYVLDGGLPAWIDAGNDTVSAYATPATPGNFKAQERNLFCDSAQVLAALDDAAVAIVDARSAGRFHGLEPEPRPGLRSGHMPGAGNLPVAEVVANHKLKPPDQLSELFQNLVSRDQQLITSCGSGITACVLTLAAWEAGYRNLAVYDGSWAEWGLPSKLPVVTQEL